MTRKVRTTLHISRLVLTLCASTFMILVPVTSTADQAPAALVPREMRAGIDSEATYGALASFADAFMVSDLFAAAAHFAPDAEILHSFDDGRVIRVRGDAAVNAWLAARAFVVPLRWTAMRHSEADALYDDTDDAHPVIFTIVQLSTRYKDEAASLEYYEAPLLLDAEVAPDGVITRLYVAYSPTGLAEALDAATAAASPSSPISAPEVSHTPPQPSALASIQVGPKRGDTSWMAIVSALPLTTLAARRLARPARASRAS